MQNTIEDLGFISERMDELSEIADRAFAAEIWQMFVNDAPSRIESLKTAIARAEVEAADFAAHTIKGSSANVGARRLGERATAIQALLRAANFDQATAAVVELEGAFATLAREVRVLS